MYIVRKRVRAYQGLLPYVVSSLDYLEIYGDGVIEHTRMDHLAGAFSLASNDLVLLTLQWFSQYFLNKEQ